MTDWLQGDTKSKTPRSYKHGMDQFRLSLFGESASFNVHGAEAEMLQLMLELVVRSTIYRIGLIYGSYDPIFPGLD